MQQSGEDIGAAGVRLVAFAHPDDRDQDLFPQPRRDRVRHELHNRRPRPVRSPTPLEAVKTGAPQ